MAAISETFPARPARSGVRYDLAALLLPAVVIYAILFVWPLIDVFKNSFTVQGKLSLDAYVNFFEDPFLRSVLWRTIRISIVTTIAVNPLIGMLEDSLDWMVVPAVMKREGNTHDQLVGM